MVEYNINLEGKTVLVTGVAGFIGSNLALRLLKELKDIKVVGIDNIRCQLAPQDIYSGMYGRVTLRFFGYSASGNRGIGCGLNAAQKLEDGEPLGGGVSVAEAFGAPAPVAQPAAATQQVYPSAPAAQPVYPQQAYAVDPLTGMPLNYGG